MTGCIPILNPKNLSPNSLNFKKNVNFLHFCLCQADQTPLLLHIDPSTGYGQLVSAQFGSAHDANLACKQQFHQAQSSHQHDTASSALPLVIYFLPLTNQLHHHYLSLKESYSRSLLPPRSLSLLFHPNISPHEIDYT